MEVPVCGNGVCLLSKYGEINAEVVPPYQVGCGGKGVSANRKVELCRAVVRGRMEVGLGGGGGEKRTHNLAQKNC